MPDEIFLDNDHRIAGRFLQPNATTGKLEPVSGLALFGWLSATDGGAEIHETLKVALTELAEAAGDYAGVLEGDALRAHLADKATVYEVVGDAGNVKTSEPLRVRLVRRPG